MLLNKADELFFIGMVLFKNGISNKIDFSIDTMHLFKSYLLNLIY